MATFVQEVISLLARKKTVKTLEPAKDYFQLGRRRDALLLTAGYNPEMDPYAIKADDLICQLLNNIVSGNPNYIPVIGPPSPSSNCTTGSLINSHIYQDPNGGTIHIYNDTDGIPTGTNLNYALTVARGELGVARNRTALIDNIDLGRPRLSLNPNTRALSFGRNAGAAMGDYGANSASIFIGDYAGENHNYIANSDVIIGTLAFRSVTNNSNFGSANVCVGYQTATLGTIVSSNVIIGHAAAARASQIINSVVIGEGAGFNSTGIISDNVLIGRNAGLNVNSGLRGTMIGTYAGSDVTIGNNNIFIGYNSGDGITTGSGNTILGGLHAAPLSPTLSNYVLILNGNGDQRVTIDNIGRTGLNQATPSAWLDVRGTGSVYPMLQLDSSDPVSYIEYTGVPTSGTQQWHVGISQGGNNGTDNIMYFISDNTGATTQAFSIQRNTGNVGIGTYAPDTKLRVVGEAKVGTLGYLRLYDQASGAEIRSNSNDLFIGTGTSNDLEFYTNSTTRVIINGSGLVGVGTGANPITQLLHVGGNVRIEGALYDSTNGSGLVTQFLKSTATGIQWASAVTSVNASGGTTGLTFTGGPVTGIGTLTLSGTLVPANGGTGLNTAPTNGQLLIGNSGAYSLNTLTAGSGVTITPGPGTITISATGSGTVTSVNVSGGTTGLTTSGGPIIASGTITLGGTLNATNGGTGFSSYTIGDILYANTTTTLAKLNAGAAGTVLTSGGPGLPPTWAAVGGTGTVTSVNGSGGTTGLTLSGGPITTTGTLTLGGTLIAANGGTGITSYAQGDILYGNISGALSKLSPGTPGQVLSTNGAGADPSWITVSGTGTVTSVNVSGGGTGLTFSGGPITTTGVITMGGTLGYANGGTGVAAADLLALQDHLGLKSVVLHYRWENNPTAPYFNFTNGIQTEVPFNTFVYGSTKGTPATIAVVNTPTTWRFTPSVTGYYKITLNIHFYDQTNQVDCMAWLYNVTLAANEKGLIDNKSAEISADKLFLGTTNTRLNAGVTYSFRVLFSGGAVNPYPSDANQMVCEVMIESIDLF